MDPADEYDELLSVPAIKAALSGSEVGNPFEGEVVERLKLLALLLHERATAVRTSVTSSNGVGTHLHFAQLYANSIVFILEIFINSIGPLHPQDRRYHAEIWGERAIEVPSSPSGRSEQREPWATVIFDSALSLLRNADHKIVHDLALELQNVMVAVVLAVGWPEVLSQSGDRQTHRTTSAERFSHLTTLTANTLRRFIERIDAPNFDLTPQEEQAVMLSVSFWEYSARCVIHWADVDSAETPVADDPKPHHAGDEHSRCFANIGGIETVGKFVAACESLVFGMAEVANDLCESPRIHGTVAPALATLFLHLRREIEVEEAALETANDIFVRFLSKVVDGADNGSAES